MSYGAITLAGDGKASVSDAAEHDFGTGPFAINIMFKAAAAGPLIDKLASDIGWKIEVLADETAKVTVNATTLAGGSSLLDDEWHQIEVDFDDTSATLYLFVDGALANSDVISSHTTVSNSEDLNIGFDGDSDYFTGSLAEVRLSKRIRHTEAFTEEVSQFGDDAYTTALYHFNEGQGSTTYDMAANVLDKTDAAARNHLTLTNATYPKWTTDANAPLLVSPVTLLTEAVWRVLDDDSNLTTWEAAHNLHKFRFREGDSWPDVFSQPDTPSLNITPGTIQEIVPETPAFHKLMIPIRIEGVIHSKTPRESDMFWWLCTKALWAAHQRQAGGRFGLSMIQAFHPQGPSFPEVRRESSGFFVRWEETYLFNFRTDLLT